LLPGIENITCKHGKICLARFGASSLHVLLVLGRRNSVLC